MKTVHKINPIPVGVKKLKTVPSPPAYLSATAKKHYKAMAEKLIKADRLSEIFLNALEVFADAMSQWEWSVREIARKNKLKTGSGYIQRYGTGATNISTELVLKRDAETTLFKCFKQFGLEPRSEKELQVSDPGQMDLFDQFLQKTS